MLKLQVVLVPPSAQNGPVPYGFTSSTADSSRLIASGSVFGSGVPRNADTSLPFPSNLSAANTTLYPNHFAQTKRKKFLHFTKSSNTLLDLSLEIVQKCEKMYPTMSEEIDILSLQDNSGCDLDPDFYVKDVFNIDNTVRVILKNEIIIDDSSPVSGYRFTKKKKLNSGFAQPQEVQNQSAQTLPPASSSTGNGGILKIAKKRPSTSVMRHPTTGTMRISTPLAHQIYPPPNSNRMVSNNSDDEDASERSFLPPPAQPQSPPIRISSSMENNKRIRSAVEEDAVSRSETVDPDKSKQQRLLSGTPVANTMTPNRVTLTGQRVVSERMSNGSSQNGSIFTASSTSGNRLGSAANTRITSGMLSIPEPRIAEIEKELKEGPSSPTSILPAVPHRIPMKEPYQKMAIDQSDDISSSDEQDSESQVKTSAQRQTSIADNNGSPVKESPLGENHLRNVHLAELPRSKSGSVSAQRKTSLEARVENKTIGVVPQKGEEDEPVRKESFSDEEGEEEQDVREEDQGLQRQLGLTNEKAEADTGEEEEENDGNDTVLITRNEPDNKSHSNTSIHKTDFLKLMEGGSTDFPPWFGQHGSKGKPYTTVLHKDIDNSKPDPRNIIPRDTPRSAAKKAAQLLSGKQGQKSEQHDDASESPSPSSSDIETDSSLDSDHDRIFINENNSVRSLNLRPLKEKVISSQDLNSSDAVATDTTQKDTKVSQKSSADENIPSKDKVESGQSSATEPSKLPLPVDEVRGNIIQGNEKPSPRKTIKEQPEAVAEKRVSEQLNSTKAESKPDVQPSAHKAQSSSQKTDLSTNSHNGTDLKSTTAVAGKTGKAQDGQKLKLSTKASSDNSDESRSPSVPAARSQPTKKEEAEMKRREREAARAAKLEAAQKLKAEKEAQKVAKQKAKEEAKLAREAEAARKKHEREEKKRLRQEKLAEEKRKREEANAKKSEEPAVVKKADEKPEEKVKPQKAVLDGGDKLKELKAKFTKSRAYVPAGLARQSIRRSDDSSESGSSDDESSSDDSSSSDEESSSISKKSRRLIVDTPKGALSSAQNKSAIKELPGVEDVPQSTQRSNPASQETPKKTPNKIPVTRLMEMSSPSSSKGDGQARPSFLQGLPQKVRPSLSSLSDLVSKGVPDVREKSMTVSHPAAKKVATSMSDDSNDEDDSLSESSDSDSDSDDSSTDGGSFISAKSASTALGKKKRGGGFASLIKDSRKV